MSSTSPPAPVAVLDSAVTWTRACLQLARSSPPTLPTPCSDWDLGGLLAHLEDSLVAFGEAAGGQVRVTGDAAGPAIGPDTGPEPGWHVDRLVRRAGETRTAWLRRLTSAPVGVGELALGRDTVVLVGALEIAVHGWDVAAAVGTTRPLPEELASRLYAVAQAVVTPGDRGTRFAPAVPWRPDATVGDRLLAHLGRRPR